MTLSHLQTLYNITKEEGLKSALKCDLVETIRRHPSVLAIAIGAAMYLSRPEATPSEVMVCIDQLVGGDDQYDHRIVEWVPASEALVKGLISKKNYDAITRKD